jgi:hypothetical protein
MEELPNHCEKQLLFPYPTWVLSRDNHKSKHFGMISSIHLNPIQLTQICRGLLCFFGFLRHFLTNLVCIFPFEATLHAFLGQFSDAAGWTNQNGKVLGHSAMHNQETFIGWFVKYPILASFMRSTCWESLILRNHPMKNGKGTPDFPKSWWSHAPQTALKNTSLNRFPSRRGADFVAKTINLHFGPAGRSEMSRMMVLFCLEIAHGSCM